MTDGRTSRVAIETLVQDPSPEGRASRVITETLVRNPAPPGATSRLIVETLVRLTPPLGAPTGLTVIALSPYEIELNWDPDDQAEAYDIERDSAIIVSKITDTTYIDEGLSPATRYHYRVRSARRA